MIIGFIGIKRSGKTTACNIIKKHRSDVVMHNFKDGLVAEMKACFPDLLEELASNQHSIEGEWGDGSDWDINRLFTEKPPLMRALMQNFGTEVRRGDDKNYWVKKWRGRLINEGLVLVDDVRFHEEANAIKQNNGILIRLERTDLVDDDNHPSEQIQKEIKSDFTITTSLNQKDYLEKEILKIVL